MAGLCWMAVTLALFLSAEQSVAVDQNRLTTIVDGVLGQYGTKGMFSLAVRIPNDQNLNIDDILQTLSESDPVDAVREKFVKNEVYVGNRLVEAKVLKRIPRGADHAEARVVPHLNELWSKSDNNHPDMMLFYVLASPCVEKCTSIRHRGSILKGISLIKKWPDYAFVFSIIFKPREGEGNTPDQLKGALERLGSAVELKHIYRCDKQGGQRQCRSCSVEGEVANYCYSADVNFFKPGGDEPYPPSRRRSSSVKPSPGVSRNVDSNTREGEEDSGKRRRKRKRNRRKKKQNTNTGDDVSLSQSGQSPDVDHNTGGGRDIRDRKVRKVGGRRVGKTKRKGGKEQKKKQKQTKKKTNNKKKKSSREQTGWSEEVPRKVRKNREKKQDRSPRPKKKKRKNWG